MKMFSPIIKILLFVTCVQNVDGASSKHRLKSLEVRLNSIESRVDHIQVQQVSSLSKIESELNSKFDGMKNDLVNDLNEMVKINKDTMQELESNISSVMAEVKAIEDMLEKVNGENAKRDEAIYLQKLEMVDLQRRLNKEFGLCEDGWTKFESLCYLYVEQEGTYLSAREACRQLGASVADIQSQAENDFIYNLCENNGHEWDGSSRRLWIGITDEITEDVWISDRTGAPVKYTNWQPTQPDSYPTQNCVIMGNVRPYGKWNDWLCTLYESSFVCKK